MPNSLKKVIDLIKKTSDRCIVLNEDGEPTYVLMTFGDYEALVFGKSAPEVAGLTENELLEKINRDIATWKVAQELENPQSWQIMENTAPEIKKNKDALFNKKSLNKANINGESDKEISRLEDEYDFEPVD